MKKRSILVLTSVLLVVGLLVGLVACAQPAPTTPTTPGTPTTPAQPETLKIAANFATNWPLGLDALHCIELDVERVNKNGGLDIGGKKYMLDVIFDDNKMDFALTKTAGQKEIHQDKVDYILSDPWALPLFDLCEENEVIGVITCYDKSIHDPKYHWVVGGSNGETTYPSFTNWCVDNLPGLKTFINACPDRHDGRLTGVQQAEFAEHAGLEVLDTIFYPPDATDVSAVGTKIKMLNPDCIAIMGGGPELDAGIMKAAYSSGWRGLVIGMATMPAATIVGIAGKDAVEGGAFLSWPSEFEPATTPEAKEWKANYVAKYGEWNDPEPTIALTWTGLKAALIHAGTTDKYKVMESLYKPLQMDDMLGRYQRFPRTGINPDGRCTEAVYANLPVKTIENGQIRMIGKTTIEEELKYMTLYGDFTIDPIVVQNQ